MPISIPDAVDEAGTLARAKADQTRNVPRYAIASMLAGAYVGVAVVLLLSVGAPLVSSGSPFAKLVQGAVFGVALTLVVFAGAELFTGNAMTMLQGLFKRQVTVLELAVVWVFSLVGNFVGALGFAAAVNASGVISLGALPGKPSAGQSLLASIVAGKDAATGGQLFWRAVLCNALVCLGLWMAARTRSDAAKCIVLWWALLAFIASGFEHSIANMTTFSLAAMEGTGSWGMLFRNLAWTVPGNLVGGALVVGAAYGWLGGRAKTATPGEVAADLDLASAVPLMEPVPAR
ncbi:MAG: formate/nitrite transporter family protein [Acidimicrobiia bacterium]